MIVTILFSCVALLYLIWAQMLLAGFKRYAQHSRGEASAKTPKKISVVVAMRNESKNLEVLLRSLQHLDYAKNNFEVIFVDDHSQDDSVAIVNSWLLDGFVDGQILSAEKEGKKEAQYLGICQAKYSWIACTDADCRVTAQWLSHIAVAGESADLVFGPVSFFENTHGLQRIEFLALIGSTMAMLSNKWAVMGNGANMAFSKGLYFEIFASKAHFEEASGDDVFLLHRAKRLQKKIETMPPEATVYTTGQNSLQDFFWQRIRWAQKASKYQSKIAIGVALLVFATNLLILAGSVRLFFYHQTWLAVAILFSVKIMADYVLLRQYAKAFKEPLNSVAFIAQSFLNLIYIPAIAICSQFLKIRWKGRHY